MPVYEGGRGVDEIHLARWGRVVQSDGVVPWLVVDSQGTPVDPVLRFLRDFVARGKQSEIGA
ncbi:hypothetical protein [Actinoplanes sp. NPDC051859]|uniref:hypothetical protein n=1 Tax=Actinoplanes sp. NPDC051859 TaxID=3363909 RepID=UPI00379A8F52